MNSKGLKASGRFLLIACAALAPLSCKESLPTYVFPSNIMSFRVATIEQLSNRLARPGHQAVHMVLVGRNTFDEVFEDSVDIKGSVRIWWQRKPRRFRTIALSEQNLVDPSLVVEGKMMLLPGQEFGLDFTWDMRTDDSLYLPSEMVFTNERRERQCDYSVVCSDPETFVVEASISVYNKIGVVTAPPREFVFIGTLCINSTGPYCGGGGGGGG
ncbi:MAG TPA: hypothetical protein VI215_09440 [Bacteroidota bacterium]|jgi:hypothetical protein